MKSEFISFDRGDASGAAMTPAPVRERPILFSGAMVRALLAGTKTQTRRVISSNKKTAPYFVVYADPGGSNPRPVYSGDGERGHYIDAQGYDVEERMQCPYGHTGERLVVRETWQYADWTEDGYPFIRYRADDAKVLHEHIPSDEWAERLQEIWAGLSAPENYNINNTASDRRWRPAIHMPRWASRILLEITGVRVERLQDISEVDAIAEGISRDEHGWINYLNPLECCWSPKDSYQTLWESINGPGSWAANPWVWVVEFPRITPGTQSDTEG